jgi:ABC-2 type transport system ATP-binding protein
MDEPTTGIDPKGINEILDLIEDIARETKLTIIMSSHQLWQVERICTRVAMLINGRIIVEGSMAELQEKALSGGQVGIEVQLVETTPVIINAIKQIKGVISVEESEGSLLIAASEDVRPQIARAIVDNNGLATQINMQKYALQDIYMRYFREV